MYHKIHFRANDNLGPAGEISLEDHAPAKALAPACVDPANADRFVMGRRIQIADFAQGSVMEEARRKRRFEARPTHRVLISQTQPDMLGGSDVGMGASVSLAPRSWMVFLARRRHFKLERTAPTCR